jgi:hypothetical protein
MSTWLSKWAPASGTLAGVLVAIAFFASPHSPGDNATGAQVIAWYGSHHTADFAFDLIAGLAVLFLVLFAVALARHVRTGDRWLANGALAGAVFGGVGFLISIGFDTVLAQDHNHLTIASAQTLSLLENDFFLPILVGFALFGILTGLAVVVGRILPKWILALCPGRAISYSTRRDLGAPSSRIRPPSPSTRSRPARRHPAR